MRIAINTRLLVPGKMDGIGWFSYETTVRLVRAHPEHTFYLLFDRQPDPRFVFESNAHIVVLHPPARHPILWWVFFEVSVSMALRKYKIDLFLSPDGFVPLSSKVPSLSVIHDINFEHAPDNLRLSHQCYMTHFFPRYARKAKRIATVSEYSKSDICATYDVPQSKVDVVYDGANAIYRPHSEAEKVAVRQRYTGGAPYVIFVSTILKRKNLTNLLLAFDSIKSIEQDDLKLVVVGNKVWWGSELSGAYESMHHRNDVIMLGHTSPDDLSALMSAARCLVYPSWFEGFGIPILEAMYAETPVVCSATSSMPEVGGDAVLYVNPSDVEDIAAAIGRLASSELREELIAKGRVQRERYSWEHTSELLWDSVMKIMS